MTPIESLKTAFQERKLTLFLGAGVSVDNGFLLWEGLVLAMYFKIMDAQRLGMWRPFPNYLMAISEWQVENLQEPLEITARKIRLHYGDDQPAFLNALRETLYQGFEPGDAGTYNVPAADELMYGNPTLRAVAQLCENNHGGVKSVVTYNYDSLLQRFLYDDTYTTIYKKGQTPVDGTLPIYHVHGYVPFQDANGSEPEDIIFTEDQYNLAASNPDSWSNALQLGAMSDAVGLMVGLSLSDRNIRRLFDVARQSTNEITHFAILKRRTWKKPSAEELSKINQKAKKYADRFLRSGVKGGPGMKKGPNWQNEITGILREVQRKSDEQETLVLNELGIEPLWIDHYEEIPEIINQIQS
ncbi:MAG: SIR2 family protein [Rhodothermales bacterium]